MRPRSTPLFTENKLICTATPSLFYTGFMCLGAVFFFLLAVLSWPGPTIHVVNEGDQPTPWYIWMIPGIFILFGSMSLFYLLRIRVVKLYAQELTVTWPLFFYTSVYQNDQLISIEEKPHEITSRDNGSDTTIYSGMQVKIKFEKQRVLKLTEFEFNGYTHLIRQLERIKRGLPPTTRQHKEFRGLMVYLVVLFVLILTVGLGYELMHRRG